MTENRSISRPSGQREHHWDALRALLMLLGIPYHVAMAYRAGQVWILTTHEGAPAFTWMAQTIHVFRMGAFFLIAGYFTALLLSRRQPAMWLRGRAQQLGVPLIAAMLMLNPLLNLFCELSNFPLAQALTSFEHNSLTSGGYVVRHLWFLIVMLYFSIVAAVACLLLPRLREALMPPRTDAWLARHMTAVVLATAVLLGLWQGGAIELFYVWGFATPLYQEILRLDQVIEFAPWFLLGCLVMRAPAFKAALLRLSWPIALFALVALIADIAWRDQLWQPYGRFLDTLAGVTITQLLIAGAKRVADRPSPLVQRFVKASFAIYLFHLPIIAGLVVLVGPQLAIPLGLKALLFMGVTLALSYGIWLVVHRSPLLRFLFEGLSSAPSRPAAAPLATRDLCRQ